MFFVLWVFVFVFFIIIFALVGGFLLKKKPRSGFVPTGSQFECQEKRSGFLRTVGGWDVD